MRIPVLPLLGALLLSAAPACAEGLLRIENCRIVDDRGPVKAMGVNYVDGFWNFAREGILLERDVVVGVHLVEPLYLTVL